MTLVSGSFSNASIASMWVVPITGPPPMPCDVETPKPRSSYIIGEVGVPDLDTKPTGPDPLMLAGVMPASASPGVMMPGQFGPMMRVFFPLSPLYDHAYAL